MDEQAILDALDFPTPEVAVRCGALLVPCMPCGEVARFTATCRGCGRARGFCARDLAATLTGTMFGLGVMYPWCHLVSRRVEALFVIGAL